MFSLNVSARCSCKNCRETPASGLILLRSIPGSSLPLLSPSQSRWKRSSCGGNVYPTYSRYLERCHLLYIRELQRQVSNKRHQLRCIAAIYTQITLHNLEQARILYFMLPCLLTPATFKGQRNVRIRCTACRKIRIDTSVDVCENLSYYIVEKSERIKKR